MKEIIKTDNLTYTYSEGTPFEKRAVNKINFTAYEGEFIAVIGHTGSGKSTFVKHFNGLLKPSSGRVFINGEDIWRDRKCKKGLVFDVGYVFQYPEYQLFEETVARDIAFGPKNMGLTEDEIKKRVYQSIEIVGLEPEILLKSPFDLSGGQKRRVAIAGVLAMYPKVLILDEPTAGLDPEGQYEILNEIDRYRKLTGATIILVTHNMDDAARYASRIVVLSDGEILLRGTPDEVFSQAETLIESGLSVPQMTKVFFSLKHAGLVDSAAVYTVEQAKAQILNIKKFYENKGIREVKNA